MRLLLPISLLIAIALGCAAPSSNTNRSAATPTPTPEATPVPVFADLKKDAEALLAEYKKDPDAPILTKLEDVSRGLGTITDDKNGKAAFALKQKVDAAKDKIVVEESLLGPKPKTGYAGKVLEVDQYLSRTLNDYDSSEYVEWSPVIKVREKDGPCWAVRLKLRAKNAFGGYILRDTFYCIRGGNVVRSSGLSG